MVQGDTRHAEVQPAKGVKSFNSYTRRPCPLRVRSRRVRHAAKYWSSADALFTHLFTDRNRCSLWIPMPRALKKAWAPQTFTSSLCSTIVQSILPQPKTAAFNLLGLFYTWRRLGALTVGQLYTRRTS
jgi:hypothetical protein